MTTQPHGRKFRSTEADALNNALQLFGQPATAPISAKPPKSKTPDRERVQFGEDLDYLAALKTVADILENTAKSIDAELKQKAMQMFGKTMFERGIRPDAVLGVGPRSTAYVQLSRKGSNIALDPETVQLFQEKGIHIEEQVKIPSRLVINPEVLQNQTQIAAIAEAIQTHPALQGVQVVMQQPAESHYSTSEETLPQLARAVHSEEEATDLLSRVARASIGKFQIDGIKDPTNLIEHALGIIIDAKLLTGIQVETVASPAPAPSAETTTLPAPPTPRRRSRREVSQ